jgi:hypothetical protein
MLTFVLSLVIACFVGLVVLGHVLLLQALLGSADRAGGKREQRKPRGILPRLPV